MNEPGWIFQKFIKKHNLIKSTLFRGGNQDGLKEFNERLIIHVIRNSREITGTDISNLTGISVQSVSRIVKRLCDTGLLIKKDPLRIKGKVGQPSIPIALNPNGVFSVGVKIGARKPVGEPWYLPCPFTRIMDSNIHKGLLPARYCYSAIR